MLAYQTYFKRYELFYLQFFSHGRPIAYITIPIHVLICISICSSYDFYLLIYTMIPSEANSRCRLAVVFVTERHFSFQEKTDIEGTLFVYARWVFKIFQII